MSKADIAVIGLAVMGQNLILNMNDNGFTVCVFNRTPEKITSFMSHEAKGTKVIAAYDLKELVNKLNKPRRIMLMVKAGEPVDNLVKSLLPLLDKNDIIIDGGNSNFVDTQRRFTMLEEHGFHYIGTGISGGEEGARHGPSIMPGGSPDAWPFVKPIFQTISAKHDKIPCCDWVGNGGAGHFVKTVHNGIEYGDMQLICEVYHILKVFSFNNDDISRIFKEWNNSELKSYLIEITSNIFQYKTNGEFLIDNILDCAGQKGTGKWTSILANEHGTPVTLISEAVFARCLSSLKSERIKAASVLTGPKDFKKPENKEDFINMVRKALYASKIISYAQGFMLLKDVSLHYGWKLNFASIASMWREGCIIRSVFLDNIIDAYEKNRDLENLLFDDFFSNALKESEQAWRNIISEAVLAGIPVPCLSSGLSFYDAYRSSKLPANLTQAQRDYFGAHTYQLLADPGKFHHTNWTGHGGTVSSTSYQV